MIYALSECRNGRTINHGRFNKLRDAQAHATATLSILFPWRRRIDPSNGLPIWRAHTILGGFTIERID